jgi:hypothetical protein
MRSGDTLLSQVISGNPVTAARPEFTEDLLASSQCPTRILRKYHSQGKPCTQKSPKTKRACETRERGQNLRGRTNVSFSIPRLAWLKYPLPS